MNAADFISADALALYAAVILWFADTWAVEYSPWSKASLSAAVNRMRREWMTLLVERDNRIVDSALMGNLMRSVSFFASSSIILLGAVAAMLGALDHSYDTVRAIPFLSPASKQTYELKLILLLMILVYSFLRFTWSLRQFNYSCVVLGAAPGRDAPEDRKLAFITRAARLNELGALSFNEGMRGYYFGLAGLGWFVHPAVFAGATVLVVLILWRREFRSRTLLALKGS